MLGFIPPEELGKYLTQYEICVLSLVSKAIRGKYRDLYIKFERFLSIRATLISAINNVCNYTCVHWITTYDHDQTKFTDKKTSLIMRNKPFTMTYLFKMIVEKEQFTPKRGDIFKRTFVIDDVVEKTVKVSATRYFCYTGEGVLDINIENKEIKRKISSLFDLTKYSYLYWTSILDLHHFSCDPDKILIYNDERNYLLYVEMITDEFKYRIPSRGDVYCDTTSKFIKVNIIIDSKIKKISSIWFQLPQI